MMKLTEPSILIFFFLRMNSFEMMALRHTEHSSTALRTIEKIKTVNTFLQCLFKYTNLLKMK